ncbi:hypothetical protein D1007_51184 [Hordeum vulgare]|nr:hypothetical protein D1007_51184 [Hordeum vulgare]
MMETSLMEAVLSGGTGESILTSMKFAVLPIAKVFTLCFMGFLMATRYIGILDANGRKLLNGVSRFHPRASSLSENGHLKLFSIDNYQWLRKSIRNTKKDVSRPYLDVTWLL